MKEYPPLSYVQQQALQKIQESTSQHVIGIDEVGLGCLAGPVTVAAVVVPKGWSHKYVQNSKDLTPRQRRRADKVIREEALSFCILSATNEEVDQEGLRAVNERLTEAVALRCMEYFPEALIVQDGDVPTVIGGKQQNMVWLPKADIFVPAVSAASCLAKVLRDSWMKEQEAYYPGYDFGKNMGYGTPPHKSALRRLGACPLHRKSFRPVQDVL